MTSSPSASDLSFSDKLLVYTLAPLGPLLLLKVPHAITLVGKQLGRGEESEGLYHKFMFWSM